jgi:hypothetical protein
LGSEGSAASTDHGCSCFDRPINWIANHRATERLVVIQELEGMGIELPGDLQVVLRCAPVALSVACSVVLIWSSGQARR